MTSIEFKENFEKHISASNPHKVVYTQIWGLDKVENTSDVNKPISTAVQKELDKKLSSSMIYNSDVENTSLNLSEYAWSAAQGYTMKVSIDSFKSGDTTELENKIKWCEDNV